MRVEVPAGDGTVAHLRFTDRADGDAATDPDRAWNVLRQVHGARVVEATAPGQHADTEADALVTRTLGVPVAVRTADCAPVVLVGDGEVAVVHAGWRGLVAGVVGAAVESLATPAGELVAHLGPTIRPTDYEFVGPELDTVIAALGPAVRSETRQGTAALDVPAAVAAALERSGVPRLVDHDLDTADERFYSHRLRGDLARQATVAVLEPA